MRFLLLSLLLPLLAQAQSPTITRSNFFEIGDTALVYMKFDTSLWSASPGAAGTNVTWDFSGMDFNHSSVIVDTLIFLLPDSTPFYPITMSADYSQANIAMVRQTESFSPNDDDYHYYYADSDSLLFLGHWAGGGGTEIWEDHFDNAMKELQFPLSYGDAFVDSFERYYFDMSGSDAHFKTGTLRVTVDGYGTMQTPDGTALTDVIRVHTKTTSRDSSMMGSQTDTLHKYSFFSQSKKGFVLTLYMAYGDSSAVETAEYQKQTNGVTSLNDKRLGGNGLLVFPNPSNGLVKLSAHAGLIHLVEIYNALGQCIRTIQDLEKPAVVMNVNGLVEGMYFVKATLDDGTAFMQRLVVKP
ncbi:MAG TPA: T9SS type A sorting domain-containing protein [Chitinophagales bacterium]|nr:T9SS type A sorting domain-containing protein [Chitinophagales bacterium]